MLKNEKKPGPLSRQSDTRVSPQIARLTHSISVFTEGILMMKTTLVGIIKVRTCKNHTSFSTSNRHSLTFSDPWLTRGDVVCQPYCSDLSSLLSLLSS